MLKSFSNMKTRPTTSFNHFAGKRLIWTVFQLDLFQNFLCSFDSKASYDPSWRTDVCITENLMENITRCICPISGTFVVLLVKKSFNVGLTPYELQTNPIRFSQQILPIKPLSVPMVVVICCGCCFLQSTIAFVVLLPNIYIRRCYISINFALMQFCLSVTATMCFIILSLLKFLPQVSLLIKILTDYKIALDNSMQSSTFSSTKAITSFSLLEFFHQRKTKFFNFRVSQKSQFQQICPFDDKLFATSALAVEFILKLVTATCTC